MKLSLLFTTVLYFSSVAFAKQTPIISCTSESVGAPLILLELDTAPGAETTYIIKEIPMNGNIPAKEYRLQGVSEINYGDTFIVTANHGRSGYAHFYINADGQKAGTSMVDINLFMQLNIASPNNYDCQRE